ncbi:ATP-binding cassette domain-containing protein [Paractinoplanes rishiriensis]|uniref:ABC transporter permease n=1 Tax=Paractinoplanes rishiriensis TaxID=1050105 RepID=A0A919K1N2_9ACTN|nr:ABC transporter ATP-binding protein [Actinoplanes rishiriensis]GIE99241.1 ABC transporter permease [Actinoplanes rishiriensis]
MTRYLGLLAELLRESWRRYPFPTAAGLAAVVLATATTPALALALRHAVDGIVTADERAAAVGALAAAGIFALDRYLRDAGEVYEKVLADQLGAVHLRGRIERTLAGLDRLDHLERTDLLDRVTALQGAGWRIGHAPWQAVHAVAGAVQLGLLLFLLGSQVDPWLVLLVGFAAVPLWFDQYGQRAVSRATMDTAEAFRLQRHLFNLATGPDGGKEIRVAGAGAEIARRQRAAWDEAIRGRYRARLRAAAWRLTGWTVFTAGFGAGLGLVVHRAANGQGTLGDVVLAMTVAVTLRDALQATLFGVQVTMEGRAGGEPLLWLRDYARRAARDRGAGQPPATLRDGLTISGVSFTYPGTGRPALDRVSFRVPAGSVVAVVGEYGSGKTTLVKLLAKFYAPDHGRILVDGQDLAGLDTGAWRARCSAAFQDFGRFHVRFGDAVGIGDLPHREDQDQLQEAVRAADADGLVAGLPDGFGTQLGRRFDGVELSEGQWQKTALARASMRREPLLFVLDEPTASLDAPSEHVIFERYLARARDLAARTGAVTVIISHRFSTVTGADRILVLDQGRLVEEGTHRELLDAGGRYAAAYAIQATAYAHDV